jgi:hypothetical protein
VVGADPGRGIGVQLLAEDVRCMAVDVSRARQRQLLQLGRAPVDDAGEVHHLGEAEHPAPAEQPFEIAGQERAPRRLELRGGHAGRRHEEDVEREVVAQVREPVDAVRAEHVRDLVRVGDDGRRPQRQHELGELVDEELRRLEMHVRVDEARDEVLPGGVEQLPSLVVPGAGDEPVRDR